MKLFFTSFIFAALAIATTAQAQSATNPTVSFQYLIQVPPVIAPVPTVVAVPIDESVSPGEKFLVRERETGAYIGSYLYRESANEIPLSVETVPSVVSSYSLVDKRFDAYAEFVVPDEGQGKVQIIIKSPEPITTSRFNLHLVQYVALPLTVQIKAATPGSGIVKTVVAPKRVTGKTITFPETVSDRFEITFTYAQPLRIAELNFSQVVEKDTEQSLRFLAQPNHSYEIYYDSDQPVLARTIESGNLLINEGVLPLPPYLSQRNQAYIPADIDGDGVSDTMDNCVKVPNEDQVDIDSNGRGDVCDDFDRDGLMNNVDNCVNQPNSNQLDEDLDGIGDVCDEEESRFTERNKWVPWVGMGTAAVVLLVLFMLVARGPKPRGEFDVTSS
jgi:hypothetical protein